MKNDYTDEKLQRRLRNLSDMLDEFYQDVVDKTQKLYDQEKDTSIGYELNSTKNAFKIFISQRINDKSSEQNGKVIMSDIQKYLKAWETTIEEICYNHKLDFGIKFHEIVKTFGFYAIIDSYSDVSDLPEFKKVIEDTRSKLKFQRKSKWLEIDDLEKFYKNQLSAVLLSFDID